MKLSVAMCTYNGASYVQEQLESIASQTRPPDELIVCDDRSNDDTVAIVEQFARRIKFPVHVVVNPTNVGSTKNFERAIDLCKGELIALSDQDDVWLPDKLRQLENCLASGVGLAFTNGQLVDSFLNSVGLTVWQTLRFGATEQQQFEQGNAFQVFLDHNVATGAAMAFRGEFKQLLLPIPGDLVHDGVPVLHDWWAALLISAVDQVAFIAEPLFQYRQHESQQMGSLPIPGISDSMTIREAAARPNEFDTEINYLRAILERLSTSTRFVPRPDILDELKNRFQHLSTRADLPASLVRRLGSVMRELMTRRYHRYSNGFYSAAKDACFRTPIDQFSRRQPDAEVKRSIRH